MTHDNRENHTCHCNQGEGHSCNCENGGHHGEEHHCCCENNGHQGDEHDCNCENGGHHGEGHRCCRENGGHGEGHHHCCRHNNGDSDDCGLYDKIRGTLDKYDYSLTLERAAHKAAQITERSLADNNTAKVKRFLLESLELTSLKVTDNDESILSMIEKVNSFENAFPGMPNVAAVCVYPNFTELASNSLEIDGVAVTSVCGGFPSSQTYSEIKVVEAALALRDGADEIDIVLPVGQFLAGDYESVCEYMGEVREYARQKKLKVILETGALQTAENIMKAAILSMYCGADFIKTSTGKISSGATPAAVYAMCQAIRQYHSNHNVKTGIKIAGGVGSVESALEYYTIVKETLGEEWLTPSLFRIGASQLANELLADIAGNSGEKYF